MKGIRKRIPFRDGGPDGVPVGDSHTPLGLASERGGSRALRASRRARWFRRRMTHSNGPGTVYGHSNGPRTTHEGLRCTCVTLIFNVFLHPIVLVLVLLLVPVLALVLVLVLVSDNFFLHLER